MRHTDTRLVMLSFNLPTGPDHLSLREEEEGTDRWCQRVRSCFFHSPPSRHIQRLIRATCPDRQKHFPLTDMFMENPKDQDEKRSTALQNVRHRGKNPTYDYFLFYEFKQYYTSKNSVYVN